MKQTEIVKVEPAEYGLEEKSAERLTKGLNVILKEREVLISEFDALSKLEVVEENSKLYRELRLKVQKNRTQGIDKWHKAGKEYFLRGGQFLDAIKNVESLVNTNMEEVLMNGEKFAEIKEKERKDATHAERLEALTPYIEEGIMTPFFGDMEADVWEAYLSAKKNAFEAVIKAQKEAEKARIAKEKEDARIKAEQEKEAKRLKAVAEKLEAEKKAAEELRSKRSAELKPFLSFIGDYEETISLDPTEYKNALAEVKKTAEAHKLDQERIAKEAAEKQAKIDAQLKKEREAKEKLQAEIKAKEEASAKAKAEWQAKEDARIAIEKAEAEEKRIAAEKRAKAPVKEKMTLWVNEMQIPAIDVNNEVSQDIQKRFEAFKKWALSQIDTI